MEHTRNAYRVWVGEVQERDLELDRNILKWILEKQDGMVWTWFICSG